MAQTLSDDLLYLIFLHALPSEFKFPSNRDDIWTILPLNVSLVCHSWRAAVVSRPSLWSSIYIEDDPNKECLNTNICRFLEKWLLNSLSLPLTLHIHFRRYGRDTVHDQLLATIIPVWHRCNAINIAIHTRSLRFAQPVGNLITLKCPPSLSFLALHLKGRPFTLLNPPSSPAIIDLSSCASVGAASQLRVLDVSQGVKWIFPPCKDTLYLPNLRELSLPIKLDENINDVFCMLSACPTLSTLRLSMLAQTPDPPEPTPDQNKNKTPAPILVLPFLTRLALSPCDQASVNLLLTRLACPSLRTFALLAHETGDGTETGFVAPQHLRDLTDFFFSSSSKHARHPTTVPLAELELRYLAGPRISPAEPQRELVSALRHLLSLLGGLERLWVNGVVLDNELFESLTMHSDGADNPLCPSLSGLHLLLSGIGLPDKVIKEMGLRKETVEEMIVSRWEAAEKTRLREVTLFIPGFENFRKRSERVRACIEGGLVFRYYPLSR